MLTNSARTNSTDAGTPIRVMILDDHPALRKGVQSVLEAHGSRYSVVAEASTREEALAKVGASQPQLVLVDLVLQTSGYDGIDVIKRLRDDHPQLLCLVYTYIDATSQGLDRAKAAGAKGWVHKHELNGSLIRAIDTMVIDGREYWPPIRDDDFTPRECDVLGCLADAMSNPEIAQYLGISLANVERRIGNLYLKSHIKGGDRGKLVRFAMEGGWKAPKRRPPTQSSR